VSLRERALAGDDDLPAGVPLRELAEIRVYDSQPEGLWARRRPVITPGSRKLTRCSRLAAADPVMSRCCTTGRPSAG